MTPRTLIKQQTDFQKRIEKAKERTNAEIHERVLSGSSRSQAMYDILQMHSAPSFTELWRRQVQDELRDEKDKSVQRAMMAAA